MTMDRRYEIVRASDVPHDEFIYELWDRGVAPSRMVVWVVEDAAGKLTLAGSEEPVPLEAVEALLAKVRRDRPARELR